MIRPLGADSWTVSGGLQFQFFEAQVKDTAAAAVADDRLVTNSAIQIAV